MLAALGSEPRVTIVRLPLTTHPHGLVVGDIATELGMPSSTLSNHLGKLKNEALVNVQREETFLRDPTNAAALDHPLRFLCAECSAGNKAVEPRPILCCS